MTMYQQQLPEMFKPGNGKVARHHSLGNKEKHVEHKHVHKGSFCITIMFKWLHDIEFYYWEHNYEAKLHL